MRFERLYVPKVNFGNQPALVQAPPDRVALHALVYFVSVRSSAPSLPSCSVGDAMARNLTPADRTNNGREWLRFIALRRSDSEECSAVRVTDVTNYLDSVDEQCVV